MSFSSLFVSGKYASHTVHKVFQAIKPIIDLKQLLQPAVLTGIKESLQRREGSPYLTVSTSDLLSIQEPLKKLIDLSHDIDILVQERDQLRERRKLADISQEEQEVVMNQQTTLTPKIAGLREQTFDLEDIVMPIVLNLPNRLDPSVKDTETVVKEANMHLKRRNRGFKQLDYRQLSYINESVFSSLIGPDSRFGVGRIAQLHYSVTESVMTHLRKCGYHDFSGMDMVKSAVVEAVRCKGDRNYKKDFCRIDRGYDGAKESQQLHLSGECSLQAFGAFFSRFVFMKSVPQELKLFSSGCEYDADEDRKGLIQRHSVRAVSLMTDDEDAETHKNKLLELFWPLFSSFEVPVQAVSVSPPFLLSNEASRTEIRLFSPTDNDWSCIGYFSNLSDFVTKRLGIDNRKLVTAVMDIEPIVSCMIETHQTDKGSFIVPEGLDMFS